MGHRDGRWDVEMEDDNDILVGAYTRVVQPHLMPLLYGLDGVL